MGRSLPDFVDPFLDRVEPRMHGAVVQIEDIAEGKQSEALAKVVEERGVLRLDEN